MTLNAYDFLQKMQDRIYFTETDKSLLKSQADWGEEIAPEVAEQFYAYLGSDPEMNAILNHTPERIHRLRETFVQWFYEMFTGMDDWGNAYAERRWRIGLVHVRIGIGPQHVVPAMATVIRDIDKRLKANDKPAELQEALSRICMIDLTFIEQAYIEVSSAAVLQETGWTERLFKRLIAAGASSV